MKISQLAGFLDALYNGVTTVVDHCDATYSPEMCEAAFEATVQSGARVVFCPSRASAPTQVLPEIEFGHEPHTGTWQLDKFKEWAAKDKGNLRADGRVTLGLA